MSEFENGGAQAPASETLVADTAPAVETGATETTTETTSTAPDRPRGEGGKFRKAEMDDTLSAVWDKLHQPDKLAAEAPDKATAAPETPAEKAGKDSAVQPTDKEKDTPAARPASEPPVSWTADMKAKLAALPPEFSDLQEYAAKRDREQNEAINRAGQQAKAYEQALKSWEPLRAVFERHQDAFQRNNAIAPVEVVDRIMAVEGWLGRDPVAAIKAIAQAYKVDLPGLTDAPEGQQADDPRLSAMQARMDAQARELTAARRQLAGVTSHLTAQQQQAFNAQYAAIDRQIADFAKDKPHFNAVESEMMAAIAVLNRTQPQLSVADKIKTAYEQAVWANPTVRNAMLAEQRTADEKARAEEASKKATAARAAASVNLRSSTVAGKSPKSMDDTLRATADRLFA